MISSKKILITGGAGFIGSNMANLLSENNEITVLDDFSGGTLKNLNESKVGKSIKVIRGDITKRDFFFKLDKDFDLVVHLAANSDVRSGSDDPEIDMQTTLNMCSMIQALTQRPRQVTGLAQFPSLILHIHSQQHYV